MFSSRGRLPLADSCTSSSEHHVFLSGPTQSPGILTRWWACCCSAPPSWSRKRSALPAEMSWWPAHPWEGTKREKHGVFLQYWLRHSQDWQPHWACHGCSFPPAYLSLRLTQHILLALALNCPSLFSPQGPASDRNYKGIVSFHIPSCLFKQKWEWLGELPALTSVRTKSGHWDILLVLSMSLWSQELKQVIWNHSYKCQLRATRNVDQKASVNDDSCVTCPN